MFNRIVAVSKVQRVIETDVIRDNKVGIEQGDKVVLSQFFYELEEFLNELETDESSKAAVRQKAMKLRGDLSEYDIYEEGTDLELDEDRALLEEEGNDNYDNWRVEERNVDD